MISKVAACSWLAGLVAACALVAGCGEPGETYYLDGLPTDEEAPPVEEESTEEPIACPYVGEPLIDPAGFPPCPECSAGGAACVPKILSPPETLASFSECDADRGAPWSCRGAGEGSS